ncbi:MAG: MFS transporter, partial [Candidatus Sericytochromatia bacterium]|nr:MFS transporter [Candidatus Sericytochromatia bacterium]
MPHVPSIAPTRCVPQVDQAALSEARRRWALGAAGFCTFLGMHATQALLPTLATQFHATYVQASLTVSATMAAVAVLAPLVGFLTATPLAFFADRKRVIVAGLLALAIPTLLVATSAGLSGMIAWRALQGVFIALVYVATMTYVNEEWAGGGGGAALAAYDSGDGLGGVSGRFLTGVLTDVPGWRGAVLLLGVLG